VVAKPNSLILEPRMNVHKNARMTVRGRILIVERVCQHGWPVAQAASAGGVSERTAHKWLSRYRQGGEIALHDRPSTPARSRLSGPRIARRLALPVATVGAVLRRLGLGRLKALDERPEIVRCERATPGGLIHIDTKKLGKIDGIGHRITGDRTSRRKRGLGWEHLHVAIDDCSRLAYTELLPAETGEACAGFLARATAWFAANGITVSRVMTDNAFAYTNSRLFKATLAAIGARHITTRPYRPRTKRQGQALHPDRPARVALRKSIPSIFRPSRRHARLASLVQSPQAALCPEGQAASLQAEQRPWQRTARWHLVATML
jgi:transposase-like protein